MTVIDVTVITWLQKYLQIKYKLRTFDKRRLRPCGLETGVEAEGEDGEAQALLLNHQSRVPKVFISVVDPDSFGLGYPGSDPGPDTGARSMEIDQNLQINLVSCLSKRLLHLQL
jgi:hypothetical protein